MDWIDYYLVRVPVQMVCDPEHNNPNHNANCESGGFPCPGLLIGRNFMEFPFGIMVRLSSFIFRSLAGNEKVLPYEILTTQAVLLFKSPNPRSPPTSVCNQ
jgi:hypothetical protein